MSKRVVRYGVFESNSSMSHSLIIMTEDQYKKWLGGLYYYKKPEWYDQFKDLPEEEKPVDQELYTKEEVLAFLDKIGEGYNPEKWVDDLEDENEIEYGFKRFMHEWIDDFYGYDEWHESDWEEYYNYDYTTPGGEHLIIETKCGRDG